MAAISPRIVLGLVRFKSKTQVGVAVDFVSPREYAMHFLIIAVFAVAALLSPSSSAFAQGAPPAQGAQSIPPRPPVAQGSTTKQPPKMTVLKPGQLYVCPPGYKICYCNPGGISRCCLENSACVCENGVADCR
jgi:hypothetical protein